MRCSLLRGPHTPDPTGAIGATSATGASGTTGGTGATTAASATAATAGAPSRPRQKSSPSRPRVPMGKLINSVCHICDFMASMPPSLPFLAIGQRWAGPRKARGAPGARRVRGTLEKGPRRPDPTQRPIFSSRARLPVKLKVHALQPVPRTLADQTPHRAQSSEVGRAYR